MDYELNVHYPLSELPNINQWWLTHKHCDVNEYADYCEIVERADHGAPMIVAEAKGYLSETDWVVTKIQEAALFSEEDVEALKVKYADIITKRQEARAKINELENYL